MLKFHMWLVVTVLDSILAEHIFIAEKSLWAALLPEKTNKQTNYAPNSS